MWSLTSNKIYIHGMVGNKADQLVKNIVAIVISYFTGTFSWKKLWSECMVDSL